MNEIPGPDGWVDGSIYGVEISPFQVFSDERGWLSELYRSDEMPASDMPEMGYLSSTKPGVARGPHEHEAQTDRFAFFHGAYHVVMWDARAGSPSFGRKTEMTVGVKNSVVVVIPPGVVHAYRNVGKEDAFVLNFPDRLYAGKEKKERVDEIRHEDEPDSPFQI
jgi:dTDP-4-dehydrorhamnose 3,5-epimerase